MYFEISGYNPTNVSPLTSLSFLLTQLAVAAHIPILKHQCNSLIAQQPLHQLTFGPCVNWGVSWSGGVGQGALGRTSVWHSPVPDPACSAVVAQTSAQRVPVQSWPGAWLCSALALLYSVVSGQLAAALFDTVY